MKFKRMAVLCITLSIFKSTQGFITVQMQLHSHVTFGHRGGTGNIKAAKELSPRLTPSSNEESATLLRTTRGTKVHNYSTQPLRLQQFTASVSNLTKKISQALRIKANSDRNSL